MATHRKEEGEALLEIAHFEFKAQDNSDRHKNKREYKQLQEANQAEIDQYLPRQTVLDNADEGNSQTARAAFLELAVDKDKKKQDK
ncbi:hypothetical protein PRK78_003545 [Emydomyces testavorans]|uniref:Uncharacterized protein n=1 Tax=Emydomyces testavorans TaxID=2070801 RepID=A0AAF0IIG6_9EURO|nr:hypothetical protein PRK78_003545 [Emydomyces testavorans]